MSIKKESCEYCGSSDNLTTFDNGSTYCFTPECKYNDRKNKDQPEMPKELIQGTYANITNRRISQRTCEVFGYMQGTYNGQTCHIANIYDDNKRLKAQQIRLPEKKFVMLGDTKDLGLVGKQLWGSSGNHVVITEGYIDMLSVAESQDCRWPVVTVPNGAQSAVKAIKRDLAWLLGYKNIVLCFDNDEAGQLATEQAVLLFPPGKVKIAKLSEKDANDVLVKGKTKELTNIVFTAAEWRPDNVVAGSEIDIETLFIPETRGIELPFPLINEMIRGLKTHRIYTIFAGTGAGKTSIMKEVIYHIRKTRPEITVANVYLEENFNYTVKSYIALDNNIPTYTLEENPEILSKDKRIESYKNIIYNGTDDKMLFYKHFGSLDTTRLFNMLEYFVIGKGAQIVVLDHLSILISGLDNSSEGERVVIDRTMTALRSFTERTGCIVILATQLKRTEGSYNTGAEIVESSARGSAAIEHLSDVIISLNRNTNSDDPNDAQTRVIKNRISGIIGNADLLTYNSKTGRYKVKKVIEKIPEKYRHIANDSEEDLI